MFTTSQSREYGVWRNAKNDLKLYQLVSMYWEKMTDERWMFSKFKNTAGETVTARIIGDFPLAGYFHVIIGGRRYIWHWDWAHYQAALYPPEDAFAYSCIPARNAEWQVYIETDGNRNEEARIDVDQPREWGLDLGSYYQ